MCEYFLLSLVSNIILGFVMHRSDFCLAGAFRDIWLIKRFSYLKAIFIIVFLNLIFFQLFYNLHIIDFMPYPLIGKPNFGNIVGGLIFGIGMVLSGGCVIGVLYKMATGAFIYFIAFSGIIFGSILYISFYQFFDSIKNFVVFSDALTLSELLNINQLNFKFFIVLLMLIFIIKWYKNDFTKFKSHAHGFINPFYAAIIISVGSLISYIIAGMPLGVTTTYTKLGVYIMKIFNPDLNSSVEILNKISLNYYNSFLEKVLKGGYDSKFDGVTIVQLPVIAGIFIGSFISTLFLKEFKLNFNIPLKQYIIAFSGGVLMGLGARIGSGCNVWHVLGGISILANNAILFVFALFAGSFIGTVIIKKEL